MLKASSCYASLVLYVIWQYFQSDLTGVAMANSKDEQSYKYRCFLLQLSQNYLTCQSMEYRNFIFICQSYLPKADLESCKDAMDVFNKLESKGLLDIGLYDTLTKLLEPVSNAAFRAVIEQEKLHVARSLTGNPGDVDETNLVADPKMVKKVTYVEEKSESLTLGSNVQQSCRKRNKCTSDIYNSMIDCTDALTTQLTGPEAKMEFDTRRDAVTVSDANLCTSMDVYHTTGTNARNPMHECTSDGVEQFAIEEGSSSTPSNAHTKNIVPEFKSTFVMRLRSLAEGQRPGSRIQLLVNGKPIASSSAHLRRVSRKLYRAAPKISVPEEVAAEIRTLLSTGIVQVDSGNLEPLTRIAHYQDIQRLREFCENIYLRNLSQTCSLTLWTFAMDNDLDELQVEAFNLARQHFEAIWHTKSFCRLRKYHFETLLLDPHIRVTSKENLHNAIKTWINYNPEGDHDKQISNYIGKICYPGRQFHQSPRSYTGYQTHLKISQTSHAAVKFPSNQMDIGDIKSNDVKSESWIVQTESKELALLLIDKENCTTIPCVHAVSFPNDMKDARAFWFGASSNCAYASHDKQTWRLDNACQYWKKCKGVPSGRTHHTICCVENQLYAMGGYDSRRSSHLVDYILRYNTATNSWTRFRSAGKLIRRIQSGKCVVFGGNIYIFGGFNKDNTASMAVQRFHVQSGTCIELSKLPVSGSVSCVTSDDYGYIYILSSTAEVVRYNIGLNSYDHFPPYPKERRQIWAYLTDNSMYIFGGTSRYGLARDIHRLNLEDMNSGWHPWGMLDESMAILSNS